MVDCRIIHGNSAEVAATIEGPIHAIVTDPPYGVAFKSGSAQTESGKKFTPEIANDGDLDAAVDIFYGAMDHLVPKLADDADLYVFCDRLMIGDWQLVINSLPDIEVKNVLVWDKGTPGMGDLEGNWGFSWESILYAKKGRRKVASRRSSVIAIERLAAGKNWHPTQKPVELLEVLIRQSTDPGDLVVDPFAGSGSTIVAASRLGRRGIGIELNEEYVKRGNDELGQNFFDLGGIA